MILLFIKMNVLPEKRKELLQTLEAILERIRKETGCVNADFYQDMTNHRGFILIEEWRNQEDLENHIRSDIFSVLLGVKGLLDQTAVIESHTVSRSSGMEAFLKTRPLLISADWKVPPP